MFSAAGANRNGAVLEILSTLLFLPVIASDKRLGLSYQFSEQRNPNGIKCISLLELILGPLKSFLKYIQQSICISWVSDLLSKTQPALSP